MWLTKADLTALTLDETSNTPVMLDERGHRQNFELMNSLLFLNNFGVNFEPDKDEIHVLVVVLERETRASVVPVTPAFLVEIGRNKRKREADLSFQTMSTLARIGQQLNRETDFVVGKLLKLPGIILATNITKGLYVRQEYWDIYQIIWDQLADDDSLRRILVVGSPGIGKSVFGVFLLLVFMSERKDTAYRPLGDPNIYYFTWNNRDSLEVSTEPLVCKEYVGLFDGNEANGALKAHAFRWAFVFASPRSHNYNEFEKEYCFTVYMNPWTKTECEKLAAAIDWKDQDEWSRRFNVVGGKPRLLFSRSISLGSLLQRVRDKIPRSLKDLTTLVQYYTCGVLDDRMKHIIFSLYRDENDPSCSYLVYSSLVVEAIVSDRYDTHSTDRIRSLLQTQIRIYGRDGGILAPVHSGTRFRGG